MIEILRPGPLALVEDAGRPGLAAVGVSASGVFDRGAFAEGARLVGNGVGCAAIEVTLGGLVARVDRNHRVALTGAECPASVNGTAVAWGAVIDLTAEDELRLGLPSRGLRSYLSVAGGVDVPPVLGSRSTDLLSGLGPARLRAGDVLPVGVLDPARDAPGPPLGGWTPAAPGSPAVLDLLPGPRTDWLSDPALLAGEWQVSPESNRVGVRLTGPALARTGERELPSEPLVRGAVQVPPSGQPVVFGPDHPTTGGYPVVAVLTESSIDRLAQCRPGDTVRLAWAPPVHLA